MSQASTILGYIENTMKFNRTKIGIAGLEETQLLALVDQKVKEYHNTFQETGGEPNLTIRKEDGGDLITDTTLTVASTDGGATLTVDDSSSFGASGAGAIWDEEVDYLEFTGNDLATAISGVTGLDWIHDIGDPLQSLYALPSDFHDFRSSPDYPDGVSIDGRPYFYTGGDPTWNYFTMYDNGTTKYLHFPRGTSGSYRVRYNKNSTTIDEGTDEVNVPTEDEWFIVYSVCAYVAPLLELDPTLYQQRADQIINRSLKRRNMGKRVKLRPYRQRRTFPVELYNG